MERKEQQPREWLKKGREAIGADRLYLGKICGCSEALICWLEDGVTITHPHIAARIVRAIGGTVENYNEIVHKKHRKDKLPKARLKKCKDPTEGFCEECGKQFWGSKKGQRFCSISCATTYMHRMNAIKNGRSRKDVGNGGTD